MSLITPELDLVFQRVLVLAPTSGHLEDLWETLHLELTTVFGASQRLDLASIALPRGPIRCWSSFVLGKRGRQHLKVSLIGAKIDSFAEFSNEFTSLCDGVLAWVPDDLEGSEALLRVHVPMELKGKPIAVAGLSSDKDENLDLRALAYQQWFYRNFPFLLRVPTRENLLREGLEWMLSF